MLRKITFLVVLSVLASCPGFTSCPGKDPYATARAIISGTQVVVGMSDSVFYAWASLQSDPELVKKALAIFTKTKNSVFTGLQVALDGVDIAQQAKVDPNITKLMEKAETAFQDLKKFLADLLAKAPATPSTMPKVAAPKPAVESDAKVLLDKMPKTLLKY